MAKQNGDHRFPTTFHRVHQRGSAGRVSSVDLATVFGQRFDGGGVTPPGGQDDGWNPIATHLIGARAMTDQETEGRRWRTVNDRTDESGLIAGSGPGARAKQNVEDGQRRRARPIFGGGQRLGQDAFPSRDRVRIAARGEEHPENVRMAVHRRGAQRCPIPMVYHLYSGARIE